MSETLLILLVVCLAYIFYLRTMLRVAKYNLKQWREMVVSFNGKQRLLDT